MNLSVYESLKPRTNEFDSNFPLNTRSARGHPKLIASNSSFLYQSCWSRIFLYRVDPKYKRKVLNQSLCRRYHGIIGAPITHTGNGHTGTAMNKKQNRASRLLRLYQDRLLDTPDFDFSTELMPCFEIEKSVFLNDFIGYEKSPPPATCS